MSSVNETVFDAILGATFTVPLCVNGQQMDLAVRRLPFVTFSKVITDIASHLRRETFVARREFTASFAQWARALPENAVENMSKEDLLKFFNDFVPVLIGTLSHIPPLIEEVLSACIVDCTDEVIAHLSSDDVIVIIEAIFSHMDLNVVAERARTIFFRIAELTKRTTPEFSQEVPSAKTTPPQDGNVVATGTF